MRNLRKFETKEEYKAFFNENTIQPNVVYVKEDNEIKYNLVSQYLLPLYMDVFEDTLINYWDSSNNVVYYSSDNCNTWETLGYNNSRTIPAGKRVYFRRYLGSNPSSSVVFLIRGKCAMGGNIMSMVYNTDYIGKQSLPYSNSFAGMLNKSNWQVDNINNVCIPAAVDVSIPTGWTPLWFDIDNSEYVSKFTIGGSSYLSLVAATWEKWVGSAYNTAGFSVSGTSIVSEAGTIALDGNAVQKTDVIVSGNAYTLITAEA